ncbi:MAG: DUF1592 domain-containing protein [Gammaproteobacteria bacterium]|nr:DUF1592 domain-containing protein [Gammaproteobacteria bacterium]
MQRLSVFQLLIGRLLGELRRLGGNRLCFKPMCARSALTIGLMICASWPIGTVHAFEEEMQPLLTATCLACHSNEALSMLDFTKLDHDLSDPAIYRKWERVFERLERGEMPPAPMPTPDAEVLEPAMRALKEALIKANLERRGERRAPLRRLTRLEYQYTIEDLLYIDPEAAKGLVVVLPAEADSGGIDTVAEKQGISPLHVRGYMTAAQDALDIALQVGPRPNSEMFVTNYAKSNYLRFMSDAEILGGGITKVLDDAVVGYFDGGSTYLFHSGTEGHNVPMPGRYKVRVDAYPHQNLNPVTFSIESGPKASGATAVLSSILGVYDLVESEGRQIELTTYLRPGDVVTPVPYLSIPPWVYRYYDPDKKIEEYEGEGIAFRSLAIHGPLFEHWPPTSTRELLVGMEFEDGQPVLTKSAEAHIREIVAAFAPRAFRRPLSNQIIDRYASLAHPALAEGRDFLNALRVPLTAILTAPAFLFQSSDEEYLDDFALASRLSYFLWRSMPDDELLEVAATAELSQPATIKAQIDRMLDDPKSQRFIEDFVGQAFRLYELHATSPDPRLYPEYDSRLARAMAEETELFLAELIDEDHGIRNLIKADFTFLNRRLAEHYGIANVDGQYMRKVDLPNDHVRGGLLSQAAIHKITANGTTTSPVPRGNFVLTNVLGQPAPPPPPSVAGLEPDTRGTTTIREQLDAHRSNSVCASCHLSIDPPGFAMESFDPIGGFRQHYRSTGDPVALEGDSFDGQSFPGPYRMGMKVDASGITPEGDVFAGFAEYQDFMVDKKLNYVAQHFASQLIVLATGAEVQFADRDEIKNIIAQVEPDDYPMRGMIHAVVQSDLFRRQ